MARSVLVDHAAELLGVSRRTVYYRIREGRLRTIRTRCGSQRVLMESIQTLLREKRTRKKKEGTSKKEVSPEDAEVGLSCATTGGVAVSGTGLSEKSPVLWLLR